MSFKITKFCVIIVIIKPAPDPISHPIKHKHKQMKKIHNIIIRQKAISIPT